MNYDVRVLLIKPNCYVYIWKLLEFYSPQSSGAYNL